MSHFYTATGEPCYKVPTADGTKLRDTTIRDAKKLKLVPSVTTIIQQIAKPGLEIWKQNQILEAVLNAGFIPGPNTSMTCSQWKGMIISMSKEVGEKAAKRGDEIHNKLELYYETGIIDEEDKAFLVPVIEKVGTYGKQFKAEQSFAHAKGYGGKVDLFSEEESIIIDFKTKQDKAFDKPLGYDDHVMQLAAYGEGLGLTTRLHHQEEASFNGRYLNIFISVETPGKLEVKEWSIAEVTKGYNMFESLLTYWKLNNNIGNL